MAHLGTCIASTKIYAIILLYFYTLYFIIYTLYYILGTRIASTKMYTFGYFRIKRRPKVCIKKYLSIGEHLFIV